MENQVILFTLHLILKSELILILLQNAHINKWK